MCLICDAAKLSVALFCYSHCVGLYVFNLFCPWICFFHTEKFESVDALELPELGTKPSTSNTMLWKLGTVME